MRFLIVSLKRNILPCVFVIIAICLVVFSKSNLTAATNGLTLWATCVVPSLFPFFVITNLLSHTKVVSFTGKLLDRLMRPLFNVPGVGGFAFVMGLISGYPVGAKIVSDFRENGLVTKDEGERLLAFTNNSGPLFILSSVGIGLFGDTKTGLLLLCTHVLACITVGIILGKFSKKSDEEFRKRFQKKYYSRLQPYTDEFKPFCSTITRTTKNEAILHPMKTTHLNRSHKISHSKNHTKFPMNNSLRQSDNSVTFKNLGEVLGSSINSSISAILMIGGFVVIFSVIISILNQTHTLDLLSKFFNPILSFLRFDLEFAKPLLSGILELTNGVNLVSNVHIKAISQNVILCAFLLGFGGFSVLLQVFSIVAKTDLSMKKYLIGKFLQGTFAAIYTFLALKFIPFINLDIVATASDLSSTLTSTTNALYTYFYDFGIFVIGVVVVVIIFNLFQKIYTKVFH